MWEEQLTLVILDVGMSSFAMAMKVEQLEWRTAGVHTTYHVVAASIFLNADIALWTLE